MGAAAYLPRACLGAVLLACLASSLSIASRSEATPIAVSGGRYVDGAGPRLAGDRIVWAQRRKDRGLDVRGGSLLRSKPATSTLFAARPAPYPQEPVTGYLSASPSLVAMRSAQIEPANRYFFDDAVRDLGVKARFRSGVRRVTAGCNYPQECGSLVLDADGDRILTGGPAATTSSIYDLAAGTSRTVPAHGGNVRLAGRYVAWFADDQVVVFDLEAGRESFRVAGGSARGALDIQADGTTVLVTRTGLAWSSPMAPTAHPLVSARPGEGFQGALIANSQVVFARNAKGGDSELVISDLSGRRRVLVRPAVSPAELAPAVFDFDGTRLAWAERTCSGQHMVSATVAELFKRPRLRASLKCPLKLNQRIRAAPRSLGLDYSCAGLRRDCESEKTTVRIARSYRLGKRRLRRGTTITKPVRAGGDRAFPTYLPLTKTGRKLLRSRRLVHVRVIATPSDYGDAGEFSQRRIADTIVRGRR